jgi:hypothetical protein
MFIVAMTLGVIAAMGVYALQIASTEVKTAGFVRQQLQTQYLSEFGVGAAAQALANNGQTYASIMTGPQADQGCYSLFGIWSQPTATTQAKACHRAGSYELAAQVVPLGTPATALLSPYTSGGANDVSRGTVGLNTSPDFFVEVTDPNQRQPPPGYATNSSSPVCFLQVTSSAIGITPTVAVSSAADSFIGATSAYQSEGLEASRARIVFGPVRCTGTN